MNYGETVDFMLSERRDEEAATAFFKQAINNNGFPDKVVMDKSGANYAGLANINEKIFIINLANYFRFFCT
jgi:putative transposase